MSQPRRSRSYAHSSRPTAAACAPTTSTSPTYGCGPSSRIGARFRRRTSERSRRPARSPLQIRSLRNSCPARSPSTPVTRRHRVGDSAVPVRDNDHTRSLLLVLAAAVTLTACGGKSADDTSRTQADVAQSPATVVPKRDYRNYYPPGTHKPSREAVHVITAWSNELRKGHVRRAARFFALPAVVQNATPPLRLESKKDVLDFNRTLPCGAHIIKMIAGARYTVATFVLTERPGSESGCGATGRLAAT